MNFFFKVNLLVCQGLPGNTFSAISLRIDSTFDCDITFYPQSPANVISEICHIYVVKWANCQTLKIRQFFFKVSALNFMLNIDPLVPK